MKVLLIYDNSPEEVTFYVITNPTDDQLKTLALSNGHLINSDMPEEAEEACNKINDALSDPGNVSGDYPEYNSIWGAAQIKVESLPTAGQFDQVFYTGFIC